VKAPEAHPSVPVDRAGAPRPGDAGVQEDVQRRRIGTPVAAGAAAPATAAMRTRSRPVTAVSASTLRAPIRAARDVRDLPAASWPAPAPREHVRSDPARIRPAASGSRPRSGLLASIRAGWARLANVPRPRRRSRLSARRPDHPGPRGRVKARSRSPASIRRGWRRSRTCRRSSAANHLGPRRARPGPIEIACLDPTRVAQITNLRRHAAARAWPARRPGPGPPRAHEGPRSRSPASIRRVARIANVPAPAPPLATVCPGARIALARGERIEAPIEIACLDPAGPCNQEPAPPAPPFAISCPRPGSPWPGEPARTGSKVAASRSRGSRGLRTRRRSRWPALAGSPWPRGGAVEDRIEVVCLDAGRADHKPAARSRWLPGGPGRPGPR
jgi:hypothetical protein